MKMSRYALSLGLITSSAIAQEKEPNILFIMSDDHSFQTIGIYADLLKEYVHTPHIDRIGQEGVTMESCYVTNSISTPSRAAILTGQYSHNNGVYTLMDKLDPDRPNMAKEFQEKGYQTAIVGKWHLGKQPSGFDYYLVLDGQGKYTNPTFYESGKPYNRKNMVTLEGYNSDVIADKSIEWLENSDPDKPFFLMCHFKAPHTPFDPAPRHQDLYKNVVFPEPENLYEVRNLQPNWGFPNKVSGSRFADKGILDTQERTQKAYQKYIKIYLQCIQGVDENVGELLGYLEKIGELDNTIVVYTSDQSFFMGEHGMMDKRFMYEEAHRMPLLIRYPKSVHAGTSCHDMVMNVDFAPTLLQMAGIDIPDYMDGESFKRNIEGKRGGLQREEVYYRYWMNFKGYNIPAHVGIRTKEYKLIHFYGKALGTSGSVEKPKFEPQWELYDLRRDPKEMHNVYHDRAYAKQVKALKTLLKETQQSIGDNQNPEHYY